MKGCRIYKQNHPLDPFETLLRPFETHYTYRSNHNSESSGLNGPIGDIDDRGMANQKQTGALRL